EKRRHKRRPPPRGGMAATPAGGGKANPATQRGREVRWVGGTDMVGPLPADLNNITVYAAGIGAGSQQSEAANALIRFLHSPEAQAVFKAKGIKPASAPKGT